MVNSIQVLVGCDPEFFLRDQKTGNLVSAHSLLPGTKLEPYKVPKGAIQVDGTAAEFNIDPADSSPSFTSNINTVLNSLKNRLTGFDFLFDPTVTYSEDYFKSLPDQAKELGCNPDFNAHTKDVNPAPDGLSTTMRTASGHIHVGWTDGMSPMEPSHFEDCCVVVKQLDYYLGLYSLAWDPDNKRRSLYGKAGAFRPKPYGAEYRTLSNVWLRSASIQSWIFTAAYQAVQDLLNSKSLYNKFGDYAKNCIDNNVTDWYKTTTGKSVLQMIRLPWPDVNSCLDIVKKAPAEEEIKAPVKKRARKVYRGDE